MEFIQDQDFNPKKNLLVSSEDRNRIPSFVSFQFFRYPAFLISVWIIIGFFIQEYINLSLLMIIVLIGLGFFGQILLHKYSRWFCLASCLFWLMIAGFIHYLAYQIPIDAFRLVQGTKVTYQGTIQRINEKYYLSKIESFSGYRPVLLLKNPAQELDQFLFQRVEVTGLFRPYLLVPILEESIFKLIGDKKEFLAKSKYINATRSTTIPFGIISYRVLNEREMPYLIDGE